MEILKKYSKGGNVDNWQEFLNAHGYALNPDGDFGKNTESATIGFQEEHGLTGDGIVGPATLVKAVELGFKEAANEAERTGTTLLVTEDQVKAIMAGSTWGHVSLYTPHINTTMHKFCIDSYLRICHFLAQIGHESGSLQYMEEIASGSAYEGNHELGNTEPGDGRRFKGRGPIQLTGRLNYTSFAEYMGDMDIVEHPERLSTDLELCWNTAGWFWKTRNLNKWADQDNIKAVTLRVNGGYNGLQDRIGYLSRAKQALIVLK